MDIEKTKQSYTRRIGNLAGNQARIALLRIASKARFQQDFDILWEALDIAESYSPESPLQSF
jgi:hypothetical protein